MKYVKSACRTIAAASASIMQTIVGCLKTAYMYNETAVVIGWGDLDAGRLQQSVLERGPHTMYRMSGKTMHMMRNSIVIYVVNDCRAIAAASACNHAIIHITRHTTMIYVVTDCRTNAASSA